MSRVYVGNLPDDIHRYELEDLFEKYGTIDEVIVKHVPGRTYGFVEFRHRSDAKYAVERRDGYKFDGSRLIVEMARPQGSSRSRVPTRGSPYRVTIRPLPERTSWQDIKDALKGHVRPGYTNVRDDIGYCEFDTREDMETCIRELNNTEVAFRNGTATVTVQQDMEASESHHHHHHRHSSSDSYDSRSHTRSRSKHSHHHSRSHSYRSRSDSHSHSHSHSYDSDHSHGSSHSHTPSRTPSREHSHKDESHSPSKSIEKEPQQETTVEPVPNDAVKSPEHMETEQQN